MSSNTKPSIGIVGGTGDLGRGLAVRLAKAGHPLIIGSRNAEQAVSSAEAVSAVLADRGIEHPAISGADNVATAQQGEVVFVTVPFGAHQPTLESIRDAVQGKVVVDVTVPLVPPQSGSRSAAGRGECRADCAGATGRGGSRGKRFPKRGGRSLAGRHGNSL